MPHICIKCKTEYEEGSPNLLSGCVKCGSRFFALVRTVEQASEELQEKEVKLQDMPSSDRSELDEILGDKDLKEFYVETIRVIDHGIYEIDVDALMKKEPIIVKQGTVYSINFPSIFLTLEKKSKVKKA
ncbi:MAG: Zn-ribbon domain-containing protein [Candidatus Hydrothermarchaeota archaeon]